MELINKNKFTVCETIMTRFKEMRMKCHFRYRLSFTVSPRTRETSVIKSKSKFGARTTNILDITNFTLHQIDYVLRITVKVAHDLILSS